MDVLSRISNRSVSGDWTRLSAISADESRIVAIGTEKALCMRPHPPKRRSRSANGAGTSGSLHASLGQSFDSAAAAGSRYRMSAFCLNSSINVLRSSLWTGSIPVPGGLSQAVQNDAPDDLSHESCVSIGVLHGSPEPAISTSHRMLDFVGMNLSTTLHWVRVFSCT